MPLTPVEIRHQELKRTFFGYKRSAVDRLMTEVADSFELVWRERAELADRVEVLEAEVKRHLELEGLLRQTLVSAERAAEEVKERARKEADLVVNEAHSEARSIKRDALSERQRLLAEAQRVQAILRSALGVVDEARDVSSVSTETETGPSETQRPASPLPPPPSEGEATKPGPTATNDAKEPGEKDEKAEKADPDVRRLAG